MSNQAGERRLQAVMFTDIKGFSAMMSADEQRTVELVLEHREIVRKRLSELGGVEHETIGDAFLTLFDSPINAVKCAMAIQSDLKERNADRPEREQVWIRVGLHLGDIIHRDGGIYGDGVNTAARIESLAAAGGICISEQVRLQILGRVQVETELLADVELKGIAHPPPVYRLVLDTERAMSGTEKATRSLRLGKQLVGAFAGLVLLVAVAFAINGTQSKAKPAPSAAGPALHAPGAGPGTPAQAGPGHAAAKMAEKAADRAEAAEKAAAAAHKRIEAMSEAMTKAVKEKTAAAMKAKGAERVKLLKEALRLDPDNPALAELTMHAEAELKHANEVQAHLETAKKHGHKGTPRAKRYHKRARHAKPAKAAAAPAAPTIKPRVVED